MKRRSFIRNSALAAGAAMTAGAVKGTEVPVSKKDFYELKVYQLTGRGSVVQLRKYYTDAVIPFLNSIGAKVGLFTEYGMEEPPKMYILHVYKKPEDYFDAVVKMRTDRRFLDAAQTFFEIPADRPVYERYETFLMTAFDAIPEIKMPDENRSLIELRTYESYNEDAARRKIMMFNDEELPLFEKVGLHPLFFGQVLAGRYMPALIYMLWFKDLEERDANWQKFITSEEWKKMSSKEIYADTVSKVKKKFLTPMEISQI
ncbi:MAG: NIPSNAP family protein [Prolixibacteraceae bacterium]